ncbi:hypothetical protein EV702DRAFT_1151040 [Suillus placidus]|uniref:Fungal-type protein kinase domain-containing protein n=1 Tax=Suillus placidus TaxID=48579 RepID=A0A9P6ZI01_9AGAM|nr:hypothetical protein EV702DRAFT_1151040 [Suillus placidus]
MPVLLNNLNSVNIFSAFDFIYGSHAFYGGSSEPLAKQVAAYLIEHELVQQFPQDTDKKYLWKKMFPRCTNQAEFVTLPPESAYIDAPDFHANKAPQEHEEGVATLFETIARIACFFYPAAHPRRVRSSYDQLVGKRRKPDVVILQDAANVSSGEVRLDWHHIAAVGEIKYANKVALRSQALEAVINASWFALCSTFGRRYAVGFALCGSVLNMSMVDHGGAVSASDVDTEMFLEEFVQCVIALTMGADEMLGDDKTINAFKVNDDELGQAPTNSLHTMCFQSMYQLNARVFRNPSALGRATSIYAATPLNSTGDQACHRQIVIKDFWPVPEGPFETDYLHYIHRVLEERRVAGDNNLPPSTAFPRPLFGELVLCTDPRTGKDIVDSTCLRRRGTNVEYEQRVHFRAGFSEVAVDLTWFATRKEFFRAILATLKAHKFAVQQCGLLHKDISPSNIFILVRAATTADAVPAFDLPDNFNKSPREYQLGDWGLCMPLESCKFKLTSYKLPSEERSSTSVAPNGLSIQDCGHSGVTAPQDDSKERCERVNKLPEAFNRVGTIATMSSQLLADPHGQIIPHLERHDLESVFWTIFWCLVNCQGPFHDIVRWLAKISQSRTTNIEFDSAMMELLPPFWMQAGLYHYTFRDTLGNWEYYKSLIRPYWHDAAILMGMEKMFNIFMPKGLAQAKSGGGIKFNLAFNQDLGHDQLIDIVEEILTGMGNDVEYLYMTNQFMNGVKNNGQQRYEALLRYSQLPPLHDPDDNLVNHPATTIPPERRPRLPSINSSDISYFAPSLQGSESGCSDMSY